MISKKKKTTSRKSEKKRQVIPAKKRETKKVGNTKSKELTESPRSIVIDDFIEIPKSVYAIYKIIKTHHF